ncbi:MAG TPA: CPBP family glutamic-type intramembrane protease, partial [Janthinobacterium sp.]|nr:CPBP family glutamic-type intramembrane protease [Janthinobacterium sp.]
SWAALLISVLVFALAHVTNDSVTAIALASVAAAGLLLSAAYMLTQRLWLGIGIHAAWNFTQGGLFSASVSGNSSHGMIEGVFSGPAWLSGGDFGVEGSVLALFFVLGAGILMLTRVNKNHIVPAPWRRRPGSLPA